MYRCSIELSARCDGQSQSEREHASSIDEHARLRLFNSVANSHRNVIPNDDRTYDCACNYPGKIFFSFSSSRPLANLFGFPEVLVMGSATTAARNVVSSSTLIGPFKI